LGAVQFLAEEAFKKAINANWHQTKRGEFKKAYKPVRNPRTGKKPNFWTGGWYKRRKDAHGRFDEDYDGLY
jgi:hypothetical protein